MAVLVQALAEGGQELHVCARRPGAEEPDHRHRRLLRTRGERRRRRAADQGADLAPPHSITSSARARNVGGMSRPIALAVLRLIASSNLVGNWTGSSLILAPRRMRSIYVAAMRYGSMLPPP